MRAALVMFCACGSSPVVGSHDAAPIDETADASAANDATNDSAEAAAPADLATTDGTVASGWYCGKNSALSNHIATWNAPTLKNDDNLFYVAPNSSKVEIVGYCTHGCVASSGHDHCTAPPGAPVLAKECFNGAGKYCGHVLGIEARSYPIIADKEGLFDCVGATDVLQASNCDCEVTPGGADACGAPRKLWIAYENNTSACQNAMKAFWSCLYDHTNWDQYVDSYGTGYRTRWGGSAVIPAACGTDYQCAVDNAKFPIAALDVVLIVRAGGPGGQNNWDPIVVVNGKNVHIHGAFIGDAGGNCDMQTAYAMHEVYEATTDAGAADCCDGEVPYTPQGASGCLAWNVACSIACRKWGPVSCGGDGSYGLAKLTCSSGTFLYQRISPADDEWGSKSNQCLTISVTH